MRQQLEHYGFFLLAGGGAFVINALLLLLFVNLAGLDPFLSQIPAVFVGVVYSWLINRRYTFKIQSGPTIKEFMNYCATMAVSTIINYTSYSVILLLVDDMQAYPYLALIPATAISMMVSYGGMRWFTFKGKHHEHE